MAFSGAMTLDRNMVCIMCSRIVHWNVDFHNRFVQQSILIEWDIYTIASYYGRKRFMWCKILISPFSVEPKWNRKVSDKWDGYCGRKMLTKPSWARLRKNTWFLVVRNLMPVTGDGIYRSVCGRLSRNQNAGTFTVSQSQKHVNIQTPRNVIINLNFRLNSNFSKWDSHIGGGTTCRCIHIYRCTQLYYKIAWTLPFFFNISNGRRGGYKRCVSFQMNCNDDWVASCHWQQRPSNQWTCTESNQTKWK